MKKIMLIFALVMLITGCGYSGNNSPFNSADCMKAVMKKYNTINVARLKDNNFTFIVKDSSNKVLYVTCKSPNTTEPTDEEIIFE